MFQSFESFFGAAVEEAKHLGGNIASAFGTEEVTVEETINEDNDTESLFPDPHNSMGTYDSPACEEPCDPMAPLSQGDEFGVNLEADAAYVSELNRILNF